MKSVINSWNINKANAVPKKTIPFLQPLQENTDSSLTEKKILSVPKMFYHKVSHQLDKRARKDIPFQKQKKTHISFLNTSWGSSNSSLTEEGILSILKGTGLVPGPGRGGELPYVARYHLSVLWPPFLKQSYTQWPCFFCLFFLQSTSNDPFF